jgi:hypothetical protein
MAYNSSDVYVDQILTSVSVAYSNKNFIADNVFPLVPVRQKTGLYFKFDKQNLQIPVDTKRTGTSTTAQVDYNLTKVPYGPLTERALKTPIEKDVQQMAVDPLQPRVKATNLVTEKIMLEKERDLVTMLTDPSQVTQNVTLSGTSQWSDYVNSDPLPAIQSYFDTIKLNGLVTPNVMVMGYQVWSKLKNHPKLIDRIKYTSRDSLTVDEFANLIGVQKVLIGDAVSNSALEGQTDTLGFVWGKNFWLMYVTEAPAIDTVTAVYHLTLENGRYIDGWYDNDRKADYVRFNDYYDRKLVATEAIYGVFAAIA